MENTNVQSSKKLFSKLGAMYLLGSVLILAVQRGIAALIHLLTPDFAATHSTLYFVLMMMSMYIICMPLMMFFITRIPVPQAPVNKKKMTFGKWLLAFVICYAGMYLSNIIGLLFTSIFGAIIGQPVSNDLLSIATTNNMWANFLIMVILAPIYEELLFRKLLIDRTSQYGEGVSVLFSGLMFGLFHGNVNQFVYAFTIGCVFGYVYVKTRDVKYTIFLHMLVNFFGSILGVFFLKLAGLDQMAAITDPAEMTAVMMENMGGLILFMGYALLLVVMVIVGIILFFVNLKKYSFAKTEDTLPKGQRFKGYVCNPGMALYILFWIVMIILQLFGIA